MPASFFSDYSVIVVKITSHLFGRLINWFVYIWTEWSLIVIDMDMWLIYFYRPFFHLKFPSPVFLLILLDQILPPCVHWDEASFHMCSPLTLLHLFSVFLSLLQSLVLWWLLSSILLFLMLWTYTLIIPFSACSWYHVREKRKREFVSQKAWTESFLVLVTFFFLLEKKKSVSWV